MTVGKLRAETRHNNGQRPITATVATRHCKGRCFGIRSFLSIGHDNLGCLSVGLNGGQILSETSIEFVFA
jgi:hypothetical protein